MNPSPVCHWSRERQSDRIREECIHRQFVTDLGRDRARDLERDVEDIKHEERGVLNKRERARSGEKEGRKEGRKKRRNRAVGAERDRMLNQHFYCVVTHCVVYSYYILIISLIN